MLHRILQRAVPGPGGCLLEVFIGDLQVVLGRYRLAVANPRTYNVKRIALGQFRLARTAEILPELRPRLEACFLNDPQQLRSQIDRGVSVSGNDVFRTFLGIVKYRL